MLQSANHNTSVSSIVYTTILNICYLIYGLYPINPVFAAGPNLITNGSFEADDFTSTTSFPNGFTGPNGTFIGTNYNANTLTGWNITTNIDGWVQGGNWALAQDGTQYIDLQGNLKVYDTGSEVIVQPNILSQTINTIPGNTYTFSFYWGEDVGHAPPENVTLNASVVDSNNQTILSQTLSKPSVGPVNGVNGPNTWEYFETTFIATTNQTTIQFRAFTPSEQTPPINDFSAGADLDNVVVTANTAAAIPTLNEWMLLLLALALIVTGKSLNTRHCQRSFV